MGRRTGSTRERRERERARKSARERERERKDDNGDNGEHETQRVKKKGVFVCACVRLWVTYFLLTFLTSTVNLGGSWSVCVFLECTNSFTFLFLSCLFLFVFFSFLLGPYFYTPIHEEEEYCTPPSFLRFRVVSSCSPRSPLVSPSFPPHPSFPSPRSLQLFQLCVGFIFLLFFSHYF